MSSGLGNLPYAYLCLGKFRSVAQLQTLSGCWVRHLKVVYSARDRGPNTWPTTDTVFKSQCRRMKVCNSPLGSLLGLEYAFWGVWVRCGQGIFELSCSGPCSAAVYTCPQSVVSQSHCPICAVGITAQLCFTELLWGPLNWAHQVLTEAPEMTRSMFVPLYNMNIWWK